MNLYKRGKVFYMDFIYLGKRVNRSTGKGTEKEAMVVVAETKAKMLDDLSSPQPKSFLKLSEAIERVYASRWIKTTDGKKSRQRAYCAMELIGDLPINEIDADAIDQMGMELIKKGRELATVNRYKAALRTVMRHMGRVLPELKTPWISTPTEEFKRFRVYTAEEEMEMCQYMIENDKAILADLFIVLMDTGMRLSESLAQPLIRTESHIHVLKAKSKKARPIPMTSRVKEIMKRVESFPYTRDQVIVEWAKMRKALGRDHEEDYVLHTCRHTCASRLVRAGVPIEVVRDWMGHSSITITLRYAHHDESKLMEAASLLERSTNTVGTLSGQGTPERHLRVAK